MTSAGRRPGCGGRVGGVILPRIQSAAPIWAELDRRRDRLTWGIHDDDRDYLGRFAGKNSKLRGLARSGNGERLRVPFGSRAGMAGAYRAGCRAGSAGDSALLVTVFDERPALDNQDSSKRSAYVVGDWERKSARPRHREGRLRLDRPGGKSSRSARAATGIDLGFCLSGGCSQTPQGPDDSRQVLAEKIGGEALFEIILPVGVTIASQTVPEIAVQHQCPIYQTNEPPLFAKNLPFSSLFLLSAASLAGPSRSELEAPRAPAWRNPFVRLYARELRCLLGSGMGKYN